MAGSYVTDEVRSMIGAQSAWTEAAHPVEASEVRRFFQATIDLNPRYFRSSDVGTARFGGPVAPPAFAVHAFRRPADQAADPLDGRGDPEFDGASRFFRPGLPRIPIPLSGILNGGYEYEFYSYAEIGERIMCRSTYRDIHQRDGRSGPLVFVVIEDEYATVEGRPLLRSLNTAIIR